MTEIDKIDALVLHKKNVLDNALLLGEKLIKTGEIDLGRILIANAYTHDYSKFFGVEWDHLWRNNPDTDSLSLAVKQHNHTNTHHPEYWGSIHMMPRVMIAEMLCDWKARSTEFGSSLKEWIHGGAAKKYGYTTRDKVYEEIMYFYGLLCDEPFTPIRPEGA